MCDEAKAPDSKELESLRDLKAHAAASHRVQGDAA